MQEVEYFVSDFTEAGYRTVLLAARDRFVFQPFGASPGTPHVLWRHDVDTSVHRAFWMAKTETELGLNAVYFFLLHSEMYNLLESEISHMVRQISAMGHWIGVHFDLNYYLQLEGVSEISLNRLEELIRREQRIFEELVGVKPVACSFHNPTTNNSLSFTEQKLAGLWNAYSAEIKENYQYISDSNGYWRYKRLCSLLADPNVERLHVLTHPEWWTPEASAPRTRIERAAMGRYHRCMERYDDFLQSHGRKNVR